jgi:hypothetical protein
VIQAAAAAAAAYDQSESDATEDASENDEASAPPTAAAQMHGSQYNVASMPPATAECCSCQICLSLAIASAAASSTQHAQLNSNPDAGQDFEKKRLDTNLEFKRSSRGGRIKTVIGRLLRYYLSPADRDLYNRSKSLKLRDDLQNMTRQFGSRRQWIEKGRAKTIFVNLQEPDKNAVGTLFLRGWSQLLSASLLHCLSFLSRTCVLLCVSQEVFKLIIMHSKDQFRTQELVPDADRLKKYCRSLKHAIDAETRRLRRASENADIAHRSAAGVVSAQTLEAARAAAAAALSLNQRARRLWRLKAVSCCSGWSGCSACNCDRKLSLRRVVPLCCRNAAHVGTSSSSSRRTRRRCAQRRRCMRTGIISSSRCVSRRPPAFTPTKRSHCTSIPPRLRNRRRSLQLQWRGARCRISSDRCSRSSCLRCSTRRRRRQRVQQQRLQAATSFRRR